MNAVTSDAGLTGLILVGALSHIPGEEIRSRLDWIPRALLWLAGRRVPEELRVSLYDDEWSPELHHVLHGCKAGPVSRLARGTLYALGLLFAAGRISRARAGLVARDIALRRLISFSALVNTIGNITTGAVGYALASTVGFVASLALVTALGIVGTGMWTGLKVFLALTFGISMSWLLTKAAGPGLRATFHRLVRPPPFRPLGPAALAHGRVIRGLSALGDFLAGERTARWAPVATAFLSCQAGVTLGLFTETDIARIAGPIVITMLAITSLATTRLLIVGPLLRWYRRRHARLVKSVEP